MTEVVPVALKPLGEQEKKASAARLIVRLVILAFAVFLFAPYLLTCAYIFVDPPFSALMLRQTLVGRSVTYEWRDLDRISPNLIAQVIASEDSRFCKHHGVDWRAINKAADALAEGKPKGGGSTISMQAAKNLFLWNNPAALRKPFEIPLAYFMDFTLGKQRLLEIYLNIVEWGPGIFGAEAAARHHFGTTASDLTPQEAAQLAAALPNPKRRDAGRPGPRTVALANRLRARAMRESGDAFCVLDAEGEGSEDAAD